MQGESLLDKLAEKAGCTYLSDLRCLPISAISLALRQIEYREFPQKEWEEAVRYITYMEDVAIKNEQAGREIILRFIQKFEEPQI